MKKKKNSAPPVPEPVPETTPAPARRSFMPGDAAFFLALAAAFALVVFRGLLVPGHILFTTDDNIGALAVRAAALPQSFLGYWDDMLLIGQAGLLNLDWTNLLLWLLPVKMFANWIHAIDLVVASLCLALFLRRRGLHPAACALGSLVAFWLGSTFFLVYAGHIGKFGVVMFAALYLWLVEKAVGLKSVPYAILAGGAMGGMILEQADSGFFFAMALGFYTLYAILRDHGLNWKLLAVLLAPLLIIFAVLSFRPISAAMGSFAMEKTEANVQDAEANWDYCTQWSWPPEETIDFIAPGYTGWRSGEPDGPYWGRMGRSAGWETTKQGFQNFKLESFYLGAIPIAFAFWALVIAVRRRAIAVSERKDIMVWSAIALVTYLLALGKFFPLYAIFYHLPGMSSIRNPVKFMQVTQLAIAVLAAFGLDAWIKYAPAMADQPDGRATVKRFALAVVGVGVLFGLWAAGMSSSPDKVAATYTEQGWGAAAQAIAGTLIASVEHATLVTLLAGGILALVFFVPALRARNTLVMFAWLLVGAVSLDQLSLSPRYVKTITADGYIVENDVIKFFESRLQGQRPYLLTQSDFYNLWLTYTFPYFEIPAFNVTQIRMTDDYKAYLAAMGSKPFKLWQASAVGYLMGPGGSLQQVQNDPRGKDQFEIAFAFNAYPSFGGGVDVVPGTQTSPGQHGVLRFKGMAPRYQLVAGWEVVADDEALKRLPSDDFKLFSKVLISEDTGKGLPASDSEGPIGSVKIDSYRSGRVELKVTGERQAILRIADKYAPGWTAKVDDKDVPVLRCDYIYQGVLVPAGLHSVTLSYTAKNGSLGVEALGLLACAIALIRVVPFRRREPAHP